MGYTIVLADDEPVTRMDLREILEHAGYNVVAEASDGFDAVERCRTCRPDLVMLDIKMPLVDGLKASRLIRDENLAGSIVLISAYSDKDFVEKAKDVGVSGYVVKPIREESLLPVVEIAIAKGREVAQLTGELERMREQLDHRKIIEKAKGVLMERNGISENEAYQMIRKIGMDKRCSMKKIAEIIMMGH